jgi:NADH-quinone oxidoreductase subunit B
MSKTESPGILLTKVEDMINWGRKNSTWYLLFATACCGIELMQTGGPRTDFERFGSAPRATPRQADLMIVAGTITYKMATRAKLLYDQMPEPKYVISMGSCSNCGGLFQLSYSVLKGIDQVVPVDVYIPGCPPRPEALIEGLMAIQQKMASERGWLKRLWAREGRRGVRKATTLPSGVVVVDGAK